MSKRVMSFYDSYDGEEKRLETGNVNRTEYRTTIWALEQVIPDNAKILELGAGYGRYSFHFANRAHSVCATDLITKHVEAMKERYAQSPDIKNMEFHQINATDLSAFKDDTFDVVLLLGPLYHLISKADQLACLKENIRVLRKGGLLCASYINKLGTYAFFIKVNEDYLTTELMDQVLDKGILTGEENIWTESNFFKPSEISDLMHSLRLKQVDHLATDGIARLIRERVENLNEEGFNLWLDYHYKTCREPSIMGYSTHGLYIGCKE